MLFNSDRLRFLFQQYATKAATEPEVEELFAAIAIPEQKQYVETLIDEKYKDLQQTGDTTDIDWDAMFARITVAGQTPVVTLPTKRTPWFVSPRTIKKVAVAASILLVIGLGSYLMFFNKADKQPEMAQTQTQEQRFKNDVDPGKYKARLVLADGRVVVLDSAADGELAKQGGTVVLNKDGQLVYNDKGKTSEVLYNTLSTARGETYATVLADGSKVWLNSGSSLRYPVAFVGKERRVEITGEAYFEVKHNEAMPFIVSVNGMEVHDLGTEFNINAYSDEAEMKTTLVSGSARVIKGNANKLLTPGQQAVVTLSEVEVQTNADVEGATAWKNGRFDFERTDIATIMRQLSRWYDIEVEYKGDVKDRFIATISRDKPVSKVLAILELTGLVHFKIEGKKVTVMP